MTLSALALAALIGCGGGVTNITPDNQTPVTDGFWMGSATLRDTSGAPSGVRISWDRLTEATVTGYYLYKDSNPIPDTARGDSQYWVEFDGDPLIAQPTSGDVTTISVDNVFPVNIGEVYYYRVSSLASDGSESLLSQEIAVTISNFSIDSLSATTVPGGANFSILGENFGLYDMAVDEVTVRGVEWVIGSGFILSDLQCAVVDWQPDAIEVTLPLGATGGRVELTVNGVTQSSQQSVLNSNPFITHISHLDANPGDMITLSGSNFGGPVDNDNRVVFGSLEMTNAGSYSVYSGDMIMFQTPSLPAGEYEVKVVVDGAESNVAYVEVQDSTGPAWGHTWGSSGVDAASGIVAGDTTDIYMAGYSTSFSANPYDTLVVKYDAGNLVWAQSWNNTDNTDPMWREESLNDICYNDGFVYAVGTCLDGVGGTPSALLICYDALGNFQYARRFGSDSVASAMANAIACDGTNLYITGSWIDAEMDVLLLKYDLAGNFVSSYTYSPTANSDSGMDITVDNAGDLVIFGSATEAIGVSSTDWFVMKTDTNFAKNWTTFWGTDTNETFGTVTVDATDNIIACGGSDQWGSGSIQPVIVQFDPSGTVSEEYHWTVTGASQFIGAEISTTGMIFGVISRWPGTEDFMVLNIDPNNFTLNDGWEFQNDPTLPIGVRGAINSLDDILICGTATDINGTWLDFTLDGTAITAGSQNLAETGADPGTLTGTAQNLTGTDSAVTGTEDTGGGMEDMLIYSVNPD